MRLDVLWTELEILVKETGINIDNLILEMVATYKARLKMEKERAIEDDKIFNEEAKK